MAASGGGAAGLEEQQEEQEQSQRGQSAGAVPVGWPAPRSGGERGAAVRTGVRAAMAEPGRNFYLGEGHY